MDIGWIGLGKLGLPCALALEFHGGHTLTGYDPSDRPGRILAGDPPDWPEPGLAEMAAASRMLLADSPAEVVKRADVVFVAVQTPHAPAYGGEIPAPAQTRDFEYGYLVQAVRLVCAAASEQRKPITLVVVSTVLPGTTNAHLRGLLNPWVTLVYSPLFIAMSTTVRDFLKPEFVLMGADRPVDTEPVQQVYATVHDRPAAVTSIGTAELVKVAYNTYITLKIGWANTMMEICHKTGADCDALVDILSMATDRLISPAYLRGGMGDAGACHPRDLIALADLERRLDISAGLFGYLARAREAQSRWLADLVRGWADLAGLPVTILGIAYKPNTTLTNGSAALLLHHDLIKAGVSAAMYDPLITTEPAPIDKPGVYVTATRHEAFTSYQFPPGSVVIDPWGYIPDQPGVTVVRVGRKGSIRGR